jgi:hypothetical protein
MRNPNTEIHLVTKKPQPHREPRTDQPPAPRRWCLQCGKQHARNEACPRHEENHEETAVLKGDRRP